MAVSMRMALVVILRVATPRLVPVSVTVTVSMPLLVRASANVTVSAVALLGRACIAVGTLALRVVSAARSAALPLALIPTAAVLMAVVLWLAWRVLPLRAVTAAVPGGTTAATMGGTIA